MSNTLTKQAEIIAARPDVAAVGLDPITILTILSTLLQCIQKEDEPDPAQVAASVRRMHEKQPKRLRTRTMLAVRRETRQKGESITKEQAFTVADGIIAQTLETADETVSACCVAAG